MPETDSRNPQSGAVETDPELLAIKNLMNDPGAPSPDLAKPKDEAPMPAVAAGNSVATQGQPSAPAQESVEAEAAPRAPSKAAVLAKHMAHFCWQRIKSYRPERKRILLTSLVLLVLLKPFLVLGWTTVGVLAIVLTFTILGADQFWRKVIQFYQSFARVKPDAARVLKLRAYVIARKWDRFLRFIPDELAHQLRVPDLRDIVAADARHASAVRDRLQRLHKDETAW